VPYRIIEKVRPIRTNPWYGFAVGLVIFAFAFVLRYVPGWRLESVPFITLFPAILVAALLGGLRVGIMVALLSFFAGWYFFLPPYQTFSVRDPSTVWALLFFCLTAGIQLYVIYALDAAVGTLLSERDRVAILFRELQHRVANNMTFVAALLRMERKAIVADPQRAAVLLEQAQSRLDTMARIHRRLYDPQIVDLPLTTYLEGLAQDILEAAGAKNIICVVEVVPAKLELPRLVTLSLLINELMTNALKHGFAGRDSGTITVRLDRAADALVLQVQDNGKGLVDEPSGEGSLGMTIIRSLAAQLGGEVSWFSGGGTTARLAFSHPARRWLGKGVMAELREWACRR
jgi:two-component sensor histidine kinase